MRYTEDEGGLLNNFAVEKRNYIILGSLAASLIVGLFAVAASVS